MRDVLDKSNALKSGFNRRIYDVETIKIDIEHNFIE